MLDVVLVVAWRDRTELKALNLLLELSGRLVQLAAVREDIM
jgi:hypothetical protein